MASELRDHGVIRGHQVQPEAEMFLLWKEGSGTVDLLKCPYELHCYLKAMDQEYHAKGATE